MIAGFNSQQFFLIGLSFGAIAGLSTGRAWSGRWCLGAACAILAMGSMASGVFAAAVVAGLVLLLLIRRERSWPAAAPTLLLASGLVLLGFLTRVAVPMHESEKAHSIGEFVSSLVQSLEWPARKLTNAWLIAFLWLPWSLVSWGMLRRREGEGRDSGVILLGLGGWVLLQLLATAYFRGVDGNPPASRYIDTLAFGVVVNALALGWLARNGRVDSPARRMRAFMALAWLATVVGGMDDQMKRILPHELPREGVYHGKCVSNVRDYLATGDEAYLRHEEIPYPGTERFLNHLRVPSLRDALPSSVRDPLPLAGASAGGFARFDTRRNEGAPSPETAPAPGLPPGCPPLENAVYWSSYGPEKTAAGSWESGPLPPPRAAWLKFEIAGAGKGPRLDLKEAGTGRILASVDHGPAQGDSWYSFLVRAPNRPFVVAVRDGDPKAWIAVSRPVEMAGLSLLAVRCIGHGMRVAEISAAGALALLLLGLFRP